jgi:hypothetical protein
MRAKVDAYRCAWQQLSSVVLNFLWGLKQQLWINIAEVDTLPNFLASVVHAYAVNIGHDE